jgi:molecular chaperone GrpE
MAEQEKKPVEEILETPAADEAAIEAEAVEAEAVEAEAVEAEAVEPAAANLPDAQTLAQELETVTAEMDQLRDQLLRTQADFLNVRRRAEQDVEKAHKFGVEKFAGEMLPVVDSLERAIEACGAEDAATRAIREGVELTLGMLVSGLTKFKIEPVDPQGETFDPALHQAMSLVDAPDAAPNTVVAVVQKGYTLNGRLLRPAMVMVSKS